MKKLFRPLGALTLSSAVYLQTVVPAFAQPVIDGNEKVDLRPPGMFGIDLDINTVVRFAINALFFIAILAALIWLIWGGIKWIVSGGDKEKVSEARGQIIAAIIGLILVILAYVILNFVLEIFGLGSINTLEIPKLIPNQVEITD